MKNELIAVRNKTIGVIYRLILKPIFFQFDPEKVHDFMTSVGNLSGKLWLSRKINHLAFGYHHKALEQTIADIHFPNPIGLAAGFDKNAELTQIIPEIGFGYEEIGSITGEPCKGNPKPRLWRLPKSKSIVVYYGLKNIGSEKMAEKLKHLDKKTHKHFPLGISIAKTNCADTVDTQAGINDYVKAFKQLHQYGDYITINISCPNAYGGQPFTDAEKLKKLLIEIDKIQSKKPIFLKVSPDLDEKNLDEILAVVSEHNISGFICSNLTKNRNNSKIKDLKIPEQGGLSGKVVEDLANKQIATIYQKTRGKYTIIGCGGIFTAEDAYKKIKAGASLLQLITGMIYEGPQMISEINHGLVKLLKRDGYNNIHQAIGIDYKL